MQYVVHVAWRHTTNMVSMLYKETQCTDIRCNEKKILIAHHMFSIYSISVNKIQIKYQHYLVQENVFLPLPFWGIPPSYDKCYLSLQLAPSPAAPTLHWGVSVFFTYTSLIQLILDPLYTENHDQYQKVIQLLHLHWNLMNQLRTENKLLQYCLEKMPFWGMQAGNSKWGVYCILKKGKRFKNNQKEGKVSKSACAQYRTLVFREPGLW